MTLRNLSLGLCGALALALVAGALVLSEPPASARTASAPAAAPPAARPSRTRASAPAARTAAALSAVAPAPAEGRTVRVRDARSGAPVAGAKLALRRAGESELLLGLRCDAAGRCDLSGVRAEQLEALAYAPGYLVLTEPVALPPGPAGELELRLEPGARQAVRVVREDGEPLPPEVAVWIGEAGPRTLDEGLPLRPDASGRLSVAGLDPDGPLALSATVPGWAEASLRLERLAPGEVVLTLVRLRVAGEVHGSLASDLRVELVADGAPSELRAPLQGGRFSCVVPAAGGWWVRAVQSGAACPWQRVEVPQDPAARLILELAAEVELRGRVLGPSGEPLVAEVGIRDAVGSRGAVLADAEGRFRWRAVPGEQLELVARAPGLAPGVARCVVGPDLELELRLESLIPVGVGSFQGPDGAPRRGWLVLDPAATDPHAHEQERVGFEVELDAEGRPELSGVPAGCWTVSLLEPAEDELRAWSLELDTDAEQPVRLELREEAPRGSLSGRLGGALPRGELVQVDLRPLEPRGFAFSAARALDPQGGFAFPAVPPGRYEVRASWSAGETAPVEVTVEPGRAAWVTLGR